MLFVVMGMLFAVPLDSRTDSLRLRKTLPFCLVVAAAMAGSLRFPSASLSLPLPVGL